MRSSQAKEENSTHERCAVDPRENIRVGKFLPIYK